MVPSDFITYFSVMAGVGATLFGLIFVVISIKPEITGAENISIRPQVQATSSYTALLNPLVISLIALVPHGTVGTVTLIMSSVGLANTIIMGVSLWEGSLGSAKRLTNAELLRNAIFIVSSVVIFGLELLYGIQLTLTPHDSGPLYNLTTLLVVIYIYGIARAWDLTGVRQFHVRDLIAPLVSQRTGAHDATATPVENPHTASNHND